MSKSLELTASQIKAYENGATMFIVPFNWEYKSNKQYMKKLIEKHTPVQKGDKAYINELCLFDYGYSESDCLDNYLGEILDVRAVRVDEMKIKEWARILNQYQPIMHHIMHENAKNHYNMVMKESNINRTYEDKDNVFLIEIKR